MSRLIDADLLGLTGMEIIMCNGDYKEALKMLIDKIEHATTIEPEQRWIPCNERLPEDDTEVIVSCTDDSGDSEFSYTTSGWHFKGVWVVGNERSYFVRAWMPLPRSYSKRRQDDNHK